MWGIALATALSAKVVPVGAQQADTALSFEVASIKPSKPNSDGTNIQSDPNGTLNVENATLKDLIRFCYRLRDDQIMGGPKWMDADRFDIAAKPESRSQPEQVLLMMQRLLADRFQLVFHRESKETRVYELVVAKNGPKLRQPEVDTEPGLQGRNGKITAQSTPMGIFTQYLSHRLGQTVVDKTDLSGAYDFTLEYEPDDGKEPAAAGGPSILTAIQDQLGLRLQTGRGSMEIFVIDRVEKPSDN
jgi:uncharacterized protein (TIGR03435 family)